MSSVWASLVRTGGAASLTCRNQNKNILSAQSPLATLYFQGFPEIPLENEIFRGVGQRLDHYEADLSVVWIVSIVHTAGQLHG